VKFEKVYVNCLFNQSTLDFEQQSNIELIAAGELMKKIKFIAKPSNGVITIPKKYQKNLAAKITVTVEFEEPNKAKSVVKKAKAFDQIVDKNIQKYSKALKKLAAE
jgi:bifunctional DNA-binding transcriptional regulator/antitoxin component of YhaV-PrlF toxin-antitoxin module